MKNESWIKKSEGLEDLKKSSVERGFLLRISFSGEVEGKVYHLNQEARLHKRKKNKIIRKGGLCYKKREELNLKSI